MQCVRACFCACALVMWTPAGLCLFLHVKPAHQHSAGMSRASPTKKLQQH